MKDAVIIGGGISGLVTAYKLQEEGFNTLLLEKEDRLGGSLYTTFRDGFILEKGAQTVLSSEEFLNLCNELNIKPIFASNLVSNKRFIYKNKKLIELPTSLLSFISSDLFSLRGKIRLFLEPFIEPKDIKNETISEFVKRRLGKEFLDNVVEPFVCGVFAGDPDQLSANLAIRRVKSLEKDYKSIIRGAIKKKSLGPSGKITSFEKGFYTLIKALADKVNYSLENVALRISKKEDYYIIDAKSGKIEAKSVILAVPAFSASYLLKSLTWSMSSELDEIVYAPVVVINIALKNKKVPNGFGLLVPKTENKNILGVIFSSKIFPHFAPQGKELITVYVGGIRSKDLTELSIKEIEELAIKDLEEILGIKREDILFIESFKWKKAIPQYNINYEKHLDTLNEIEKLNEGVFILGNFREGISTSDTLKYTLKRLEDIKMFLRGVKNGTQV